MTQSSLAGAMHPAHATLSIMQRRWLRQWSIWKCDGRGLLGQGRQRPHTGAESFRDTSGQLLAPRAAGEAEDAGWPSHRQAPALNLLPDPGILLPHQGLPVLQRHRAAPHPVTQGTAPGRHLAIEPTDTLPDQAQLLLRWPTAHTLGQDFQGVGMPPSQAALGFSRGSDTSRATASEAHGSPPRT